MQVLLDECLPRKLKDDFQGCEVSTVPEMGRAGKKNGELLGLATSRFNVFITADQNLTYQQKLEGAKMAVIVLVTKNNRLESFRSLMPQVLALLKTKKLAGVTRIAEH